MKKSTKSVLLSALVFPGAGHFFLKQYLRGTVLFALSSAGLAVLIATTVQQAVTIVENLQQGDVPPDAQALSELLAKSTANADNLIVNIATYSILLCWVVGIIDSYRIGSRQ